MISVCGTVWGKRYGSYLYAIFSDDYVYFGETGDVPSARWGQHLGHANSSFTEKLAIAREGMPEYEGEVFFVGLHCLAVDTIEPSKRKIARRAIEEELHRQFLLNRNLIPGDKLILSTPPSAPVRQKFPFVPEKVAEEAFRLILKQYLDWLKGREVTSW